MPRIGPTLRRFLLLLVITGTFSVGSTLLYAFSGDTRVSEYPPPVSDGVNVILEAADIDVAYNLITLRIELAPSGSYLDDANDTFAVPIRIVTKHVANGPVNRDIPAGTPVGKDYLLDYPLEGNPLRYPLDTYRYSYEYFKAGHAVVAEPLIKIEKAGDGASGSVPVGMLSTPSDVLEGWSDHWKLTVDGSTLKTELVVNRSGGVLVFVTIIMILMIVLSNLAILVAWSAYTGRRPVEIGFAGWLAALLFALIPLRVNLPGAPPIGAWIDAVVFFWVEVAVLFAMATFIAAWFRHSHSPDHSKPGAARSKRR